MEKRIKFLNTLVILVFCLVIYAPFFLSFFVSEEDQPNKEKRELAQIPPFHFSKEFASQFEDYYNDHFVFRNKIIAAQSLNKIEVFKSSPFPDKALFGKNKFLFLNYEEVYISYAHRDLLSEEKLADVTEKFKIRRDSLLRKGIPYYFGILPNKHTIYKDQMPFVMNRQIIGAKSLTDQLKSSFESIGLDFFDPRDVLLNAKDSISLYLKFDTHWNVPAAYLTYYNFFEMYPELGVKPLPIGDFKLGYNRTNWGDLITLMGVDSIEGFVEETPWLALQNDSFKFTRPDVKDLPPRALRTLNNNEGAKKQRVLFFGDSFSHNLKNYFSLHFQEVIYLRDVYNPEMVNKLAPDIIIDLAVERFLYKHF